MIIAPDTLVSERIKLRRLIKEDAEWIFHYASDSSVVKYMSWPIHRDINDTHKFLNTWAQLLEEEIAEQVNLKDLQSTTLLVS